MGGFGCGGLGVIGFVGMGGFYDVCGDWDVLRIY